MYCAVLNIQETNEGRPTCVSAVWYRRVQLVYRGTVRRKIQHLTFEENKDGGCPQDMVLRSMQVLPINKLETV